jgi:thiamine pyrophosphate-dependent acetolactate synthase large subunit-like protein
MGSFEILLWTVPVLFALALLFAILLWCRSWRREEGWETDRRLKLLTAQVTRLSELVDQMEKTLSVTRTAQARLSEQMTALAADLPRPVPSSPVSRPGDPSPGHPPPSKADPVEKDRYERAREMLASGTDPVEVARQLGISRGDVDLILRMMDNPPKKP